MMSFKIKIVVPVLFFLVLFVLNINLQAKEYVLTLDESIQIALEKSYDMKSLRLTLTGAEQGLVAAKGRFKTNADVSLQLPNWAESVTSIPVQDALPVFNTTGEIQYYGQLNINQPLPTDGYIRLRSTTYHRDVSTFRADLNDDLKRKDVYTSLSLQFNQPLFTINNLKLGLQQADLNYELASRRFNQRELQLIYSVTAGFFDLYRTIRQHQISLDNVEQQRELYDIASKKFNAGLIPETEALEMEVDLADSQNMLVQAESDMETSRDSFKQLIGLNLDDNISVHTAFEYNTLTVNLNDAIAKALQNRIEIRENEIQLELAKINVKQVDARSEIRGDLWASYELVGVSDPNLPYGSNPQSLWNSSLEDMNRRPNNRSVGFTLSVPLFDWGVNRAEVQAAQATLNSREIDLNEEKKTIVREVRAVVRGLKETEDRLSVLEKREKIAQRNFDITLERFNNGDITSVVLANNRDRLISAKTAYLNAYIEYRLTIADLKRKTLWDFEKDRSLVK
ncbi:TolC family protein [candidate division KSB1 bacterium]|nr:TolC family protein [candidate division KSB1 bacterium]